MAKVKGKREPAPDDPGKKGGRPSMFRKEYVVMVRKLARLGALEKQIAEFFEVSEDTITLWKRKHPEFIRSLREGRIMADAEISDSLYHRARGYSHKAVKIFADPKTGKNLVIPYKERHPPDTQACIFWLTNRQRDKWRARLDVKHDVTEQLAARLSAARKRMEKIPKKGEEE